MWKEPKRLVVMVAAGFSSAAAAQPRLVDISWAAPVDGEWGVAANWSPANVPTGQLETALLGLSGAYTVRSAVSLSVAGVSIGNAEAILRVEGSDFTLSGTALNNDGTVVVATDVGAANDAQLRFTNTAAPITLGGTGLLRLDAAGHPNTGLLLQGFSAVTLNHGEGHTIAGSGVITMGTTHRINNSGLIVADEPGAVLDVRGNVYQEEGPGGPGVLRADGGILETSFLSLRGGTLEGVNGGLVWFGSFPTLNGVTLEGDAEVLADNTASRLFGDGLTNNGTVTIATDVGTGAFASLAFADAAVPKRLDGTGVVRLDGAGNINTKLEVLDGVTLAHGASHTIAGNGLIDVNPSARLENAGLIVADDAGGVLTVTGAVHQEEGDGAAGVLRADEGGVLRMQSVELHGGTLEAVNGGLVQLTGATELHGVTMAGEATASGGFVDVYGPGLTHDGMLTIVTAPGGASAQLRFLDAAAPMVLGGTGVLRMEADTPIIHITTGAGVTVVHGPGRTITGSGSISSGPSGRFVNEGTISPGTAADPFGEIGLQGNDVELAPTSVLEVQIGGEALGMFDRFTSSGAVQLGGTLKVELAEGYEPAGGEFYNLMTGSGQFDTLVLPPRTRVVYGGFVQLRVACDGDFNNDGLFNVADFGDFRIAYLAGDLAADYSEDGVLTVGDFTAFRGAYLAGCP